MTRAPASPPPPPPPDDTGEINRRYRVPGPIGKFADRLIVAISLLGLVWIVAGEAADRATRATLEVACARR